MSRGVRRFGVGVGALVLLAACVPIPHPNYVVREGPESPVTFELLSGDARYAVVRSTGPSATVPAAGRWRVNRSTGSPVALPSGYQAVSVSRDGSRVLILTPSGSVIWSAGATLVPPAGAKFSEDLTFGVFVDTDGAVKKWDSATQSIALAETGIPRPPGATVAQAKAISDDGLTVEYTLSGTQLAPIERFASLAAGTAVDRPFVAGPPNSYVNDQYVLAADGTGFVHAHEVGTFDLDVPRADEAWADLVELPSGEVQRRYTSTTRESIERAFISADGDRAWVYQSERDHGDACSPGLPESANCVTASHAIAFWAPNSTRTFDTGDNELGGIDVSRDARFLLLDRESQLGFGSAPKGPVRIFDAFTPPPAVETLSQAETGGTLPASSVAGQVSDNLQVVATTTNTGKGWYEYSVAP